MWISQNGAGSRRRGTSDTCSSFGHWRRGGRSDVLHRVYSRDGLGSYGGILKKGLTAMPETWDAMTDGYQSHNHCMLGHVIEWFYGYVGGIRQQAGDVGWKRVLIAPVPGPLSHAEVTFESPAGRITSRWTVESGKFTLRAEVPDGVHAMLRAPDGTSRDVGSGKHELEGRYERAAQ
ncbi:MAG TPA: alpha-L-rhamnosidase C-terminal domain-containing protein [Phycisphaerae bacterium]|nr:alpha-L-rhamnosidase C-terminal domain-containing protein [Phycisphaerae bacterium]